MVRNQIVVDRLKLFGALKRSKKFFSNDIVVIEKIITSMREDKNNHYLSIPKDDFNKVSYSNFFTDKLNNENRIKITFGRYVRRRLRIKEEELSDTVLSNLSEFISIAIGKKKDVESKQDLVNILTGKDIVSFYKNSDGYLHTCMTGVYKTKIIEFYGLNPDKVSLIVSFNKKARALLWTTDDNKKVLDRIYPNSGIGFNQIKVWAIGQKIIKPNKSHKITMKHNGQFPYMDTFCYGRFLNVKSSRHSEIVLSTNAVGNEVKLNSQNGSFEKLCICVVCNKLLDRHVAFIGHTDDKYNYYCEKCVHTKTTLCELCNIRYDKKYIVDDEDNSILKDIGYDGRFCKRCLEIKRKCFMCGENKNAFETILVNGKLRDFYLCFDCIKIENKLVRLDNKEV